MIVDANPSEGEIVTDRRAAGELADEVLGILQAAGKPLAPADVRERLGGDLAYTTVVTILSRLHAKGVLDRARSGRAYRYAPVADEPGLAARRMASVLAGEPDRQAVLARFVSGLSDEDEQALRRMLDETGEADRAGGTAGAGGDGEGSGARGGSEAREAREARGARGGGGGRWT
jgi:predicted transcriptional regulator